MLGRKRNCILCVVMVIALTLPAHGVGIGDVPELRFNAMDGTRVDLENYRGNLVLISFWAGRSSLSREGQAKLVELKKRYGERGLVILGINCDARYSDAEQYIKDLRVTWPVYHERDGHRAGIARPWGIPRVPYYFIISPDGAVVWSGYKSNIDDIVAGEMLKHPPRLVDPAKLARAHEELDAVEKALGDEDLSLAVRKFALLDSAVRRDPEFDKRYSAMSKLIESAVDSLLKQIDEMIVEGRYPEAGEKLKALIPQLAGTSQQAEARKRLNQLRSDPAARVAIERYEQNAAADEAMTAASKLRTEGDHESAYLRLQQIAQNYPETPSGQAAARLLKEYEKDTDFIERLHTRTIATRARAALSLADSYRQAGRSDLARQKYLSVIEEFPGTSFADDARAALDTMK